MIFLEQESNIAEIKNLFNRSPLQEIFLAHLEETTKVMRKSAVLSLRLSSPWQALRGSGSTLPLPYRRGHSVPRERYSLQRCSGQACFPSPSFYKLVTKSPCNGTGARTSPPLCFSHHKVTGSEERRVPQSRQLPAPLPPKPPRAQIQKWSLWREERGSWQGKPLNVPFCKNSTWMVLTSTEGFRTNSATDGASAVM